MPTEYAPSSNDRATITVPNDGELASAASLVGLKQLGNITKWIKDQLALVAFKAAANVFTKGQTINAEQAWADAHLLTTTQMPGDDPTDIGAPGTNKWKLALGPFPTDPTCWVGFWVGQSTKRFTISYNARWHIPTQKWRQLDTARDSYAFVCRDAVFLLSKVAAGSAAWSDWPAGGDVAANRFTYDPPQVITKGIDPTAGSGDGGMTASGRSVLMSPNNYRAYPLRFPHGSKLGQVKIKVQATGNDAEVTVRLTRRYNVNFGDSSVPAFNNAVGTLGPVLLLKDVVTTLELGLSFGNMTVDKNEGYGIHLQTSQSPPAPAGWLDILAIEVAYQDFGPRNE